MDKIDTVCSGLLRFVNNWEKHTKQGLKCCLLVFKRKLERKMESIVKSFSVTEKLVAVAQVV